MNAATSPTVGVLAEPYLYAWQVRALDRLTTTLDVDISLVVQNALTMDRPIESWNARNGVGGGDIVQFLDLLRRERAWALVLAERNLGRLLGDDDPLWHRHALDTVECLSDATLLTCEPRLDGSWFEFPADVVDSVANRCDVVIRFGFGLIRGAILDAPTNGVLSFHPADIREFRGMGPPPIFYEGRDRAGATLQRLNESIDGGEIVAYDETDIGDCDTLWDVFNRVLTVQIPLLTSGVENVLDPSFEPIQVADEDLGEFYPRSRRRDFEFSGRILRKNLSGRVRRRLRAVKGWPFDQGSPTNR